MRLCVFLPNWVGDVVMATPALRALKQLAGDQGELVGVCRPYVADVLAGNQWLDRTVEYEKGRNGNALTWWQVAPQLRQMHLDAVVLLTNSLRTAWMAYRSGATERVGFSNNGRGWMLTTRLYEPRRRGKKHGLPPIDSYLNLAYAAGSEWQPPKLELATTDDDERAADRIWDRYGWARGDAVAVLNSGGAFGGAKHWPAEHFASLADRLAGHLGMRVLVNCGPAEREIARTIVAQAKHPSVVSLADEANLPIGLTKACIRRAKLLVTTDSGPRFFGIAFGLPVVTLFGPTDPQATRTHYADEIRLALNLDCQPCWHRTCPLGHHRCLRDLTVDTVFRAVGDLTAQTNQVRSVA